MKTESTEREMRALVLKHRDAFEKQINDLCPASGTIRFGGMEFTEDGQGVPCFYLAPQKCYVYALPGTTAEEVFNDDEDNAFMLELERGWKGVLVML